LEASALGCAQHLIRPLSYTVVFRRPRSPDRSRPGSHALRVLRWRWRAGHV